MRVLGISREFENFLKTALGLVVNKL